MTELRVWGEGPMLRPTLALATVSLVTVVALSIALVAVSDTSEADNNVPRESVSETRSNVGPLVGGTHGAAKSTFASSPNQGREQNAAETQYSNEDRDYGDPEPPQDEGSPQVRGDIPTTVYYDFYTRWLAREGDVLQVLKVKDAPSEGSAPGVRASAGDLSVMELPTPYSQIVDNASPRHYFSARDWKQSSKRATRYGEDFEYTNPAQHASPAWFRIKIPTAGYYTIYARWPAAKGNNPAARFHISTASGLEKVEVDQGRDGGMWVRLGAYEMKAANRYSVQVSGRSKAEGRVVADAVKVVGGTQASPQAHANNHGAVRELAGENPAPGGNLVGTDVVERARTHVGTPYRHSPPLPCQAYRSEDCSCLTRLVYSEWLTIPDDPIQQWQVGRSVEKSALLPGDLVFFKEAGEGNPITHVAIYSGGGNIIHSSSYWGKVVERPMNSVSGYYGAKRLN
jgi:cell wall-associated NlpC family hydrolase